MYILHIISIVCQQTQIQVYAVLYTLNRLYTSILYYTLLYFTLLYFTLFYNIPTLSSTLKRTQPSIKPTNTPPNYTILYYTIYYTKLYYKSDASITQYITHRIGYILV